VPYDLAIFHARLIGIVPDHCYLISEIGEFGLTAQVCFG
jgi:hypothetical protein